MRSPFTNLSKISQMALLAMVGFFTLSLSLHAVAKPARISLSEKRFCQSPTGQDEVISHLRDGSFVVCTVVPAVYIKIEQARELAQTQNDKVARQLCQECAKDLGHIGVKRIDYGQGGSAIVIQQFECL